MKNKLLVIFVLMSVLSACSNKSIYNAIQENRQSACPEDLNTHARDECRTGLDKTYRDYERDRKSLIKKDQL
jgi:hypothetical protein